MAIESEVYGLNGQMAQQQPFYLDMLQAIPPAWATVGWNSGRVSRTMMSPRARGMIRRGTELSGQGYGQGIVQTFSPRRLTRLSRAANIDPSFHPNSKMYSPFNFLSSAGNFAFKKRTATNVPLIGQKANNLITRASGMASGSLGVPEGTVPFSAGTVGRISGMSKISGVGGMQMSDAKFLSKYSNMTNAIMDINPNHMWGASQWGSVAEARAGMASEFGSTITGSVSGKAAGYIQGATMAGKSGDEIAAAVRSASGAYRGGIEKGLQAANEGKMLAKVAPFAGPAMRGVTGASWVMLAHDAAMLAGRAVGGVTKGIVDAGRSTMGSIDKPVMGMGFKDNTVAATSRQRGVLAIQNSQLNARSILGSEASMMAAHFG